MDCDCQYWLIIGSNSNGFIEWLAFENIIFYQKQHILVLRNREKNIRQIHPCCIERYNKAYRYSPKNCLFNRFREFLESISTTLSTPSQTSCISSSSWCFAESDCVLPSTDCEETMTCYQNKWRAYPDLHHQDVRVKEMCTWPDIKSMLHKAISMISKIDSSLCLHSRQ